MDPSHVGTMHEVPLDDLFFSTTDSRGVIDEVNEVFTRNARYTREQLIGAPHNIIRHPDMPAGLFRIMWDQLDEGVPVCGYVLNRAQDGSAYWAFATIVPIGERFLSVRATPCNLAARDLFHGLYRQVRAHELRAREIGAGAADAAVIGREMLTAALEANGFGSYAELQLDLVPEEVAAREAAGPRLPDLTDGPHVLRTMVGKAADARAMLGGFNEQLTASVTDADALTRDLRRTDGALTMLGEHIRSVGRAGIDIAPPAITDGIGDARTCVDALTVGVAGLVRLRKHLRLVTAIARLQAEAVARYVVAVAGGTEDPRVSERALGSLCDALLAILDADLEVELAASGELVGQVSATADALVALRDGAEAWRTALGAPGNGSAAVLVDLDVAIESLGGLGARVRQHGEGLRPAGTALDRDKLAEQLGAIVELSATV